MLESDDVAPQVVGAAARTAPFDRNNLRRLAPFTLQEVVGQARHVEHSFATRFVQTLEQTLLVLKEGKLKQISQYCLIS